MKKISKKVRRYAATHKIISIISLVIIGGIGYFAYGKLFSEAESTKYVLGRVMRRDVVVSVTGTGQISASDQIEVKSKVSGDIVWIGTSEGKDVRNGQAIFRFDTADIEKSISDAEISLKDARLQLEKNIIQAPIDYQKKIRSLADAKEDLSAEYVNTFNTISDAYLKIPAIMTNLENVIYGTDLGGISGQWNVNIYKDLFSNEGNRNTITSFSDIAIKDYNDARTLYDATFSKFKTFTRSSSEEEIESFLNETYDMVDIVSRATKSEKNLIDTVIDIAEQEKKTIDPYVFSAQSELNSNVTTSNGVLTSLLSQKTSLKKIKDSIVDIENEITLLEISNPNGDNPIDLQAQKNDIKKQENDISDLKAQLADYTVYAPFSGTIATVNVKNGDSVSAGTSLATLITKQKIAEISLNEIDAAKVKVGQKATLTFDAADGISTSGEVVLIDTIGTVSQGVVSYTIKIGFNIEDERIKPGMSVNASIVTDIAENVIAVPNNAIKTQGVRSYVEVAESLGKDTASFSHPQQEVELPVPPRIQIIETGLSNDSVTEIKKGLDEGIFVVTRTILPTGENQNRQTSSFLSGVGTPGGSGTRMMVR